MHALLRRAQEEGHPLIDGQTVTFLWQGSDPPELKGDFNDWGASPLPDAEQIDSELWRYTVTLPEDTYMEYDFMRGGVHLGDPLNAGRTIPTPFGSDNHTFAMPGWSVDPITAARPLRGTLTAKTIKSASLLIRGRRRIHLYQPPARGPVPLLVVFDGQDYLDRGRLLSTVENLMEAGRIRPVALALVEHAGADRFIEYAASESTAFFVVSKLLPFARRWLDITQGPQAILGTSMGGLQAAYTALRFPGEIDTVLCQSGAFRMFGHDFQVFPLLEHYPTLPLRFWLNVGHYDYADLMVCNPRLRDMLQRRGYPVAYRQYPAGHNYTAWAAEIWHGLEWAFTPRTGPTD
ncbi:MAG: esterase family protein [Chloroflexi bacterium]|nr:esterase family protein [Chloroflexota bacterium]